MWLQVRNSEALDLREQRVEKLADGSTKTTTYQYDPTKTQLINVNDTAWTYDPAGQLTSNGKYTFDWDAEGRLTAIKNAADSFLVASYEYDHLGRRVVERVREHTTQFLYDGNSNNVVAEFANGVLQKYYTWSPTGLLLSITDMRVEFSGGTIHGHPITEAEYKKLLK